jgi:hypothetical protein
VERHGARKRSVNLHCDEVLHQLFVADGYHYRHGHLNREQQRLRQRFRVPQRLVLSQQQPLQLAQRHGQRLRVRLPIGVRGGFPHGERRLRFAKPRAESLQLGNRFIKRLRVVVGKLD